MVFRQNWRHVLMPSTRNPHTARRRRNFVLLAGTSVLLFILACYKWFAAPSEIYQDYRLADRTDIFENFVGRDTCGFGALDLHRPFDPLCQNASSMLRAMSDGGRGGFDMPYQPRGCDLRFYTTAEICAILNRFESVLVYGDSLMRHLTSAFAMLLRENLDFGGQQQWRAPPEGNSCHCDGQTQLWFCHQTDVRTLSDVYENDPESIQCPTDTKPAITFQTMTKWPLNEQELDWNILSSLNETRPNKPYAFVFGHGLWNDMRPYESIAWIDSVQTRVSELRPYYNATDIFWPRIFVTPSAAGENKQDGFIMTQGNKAVIKFEKFMRDKAPDRDLAFLGTYNMSVQGTIPDGTHSGIRINILKAMTIINWLDSLDTSAWNNITVNDDVLADQHPLAR